MTGHTGPCKLWDLAFDVVSGNLQLICELDATGTPRRLQNDVKLPWVVCDQLISCLAVKNALKDSSVVIFSDPKKANLKRVNLSKSEITDIAIMTLTKQRPLELDIHGCTNLTDQCLPDLMKLKSLQSLNLSHCPKVLENYLHVMGFHLPELVKLDVSYTDLSAVHLHYLTKRLPRLMALDVSGVVKNGDVSFLVQHRRRLSTLVLHDCIILENGLRDVCKLIALRHLDISVADVSCALELTRPMLSYLFRHLPNLTYLDLSGNRFRASTTHDVFGIVSPSDSMDTDEVDSIEADGEVTVGDVTGSHGDERTHRNDNNSKIWDHFNRTFEFLGLLYLEEAFGDPLPAKTVASLSCEENILTALQRYRERKSLALAAMNAFFDTVRAVDCKQVVACVQAITSIMKSYPGDEKIQIPGSASLFHLSRANYRIHFSSCTKQLIISTLLDAIELTKIRNITLLRNCGLTLLNFDIPTDFYFEFERIVRNLLNVVKLRDSDGLLPRIYVYMCNSIVCHVEGDLKLLVGRLGLVECMLQLIRAGLEKRRYDEVMETAWSALWNVTDETPFNCDLFVSHEGLRLFLSSLNTFPGRPDLLRNMMGLIGNVAEVPRLRPQLSTHIGVFMELLKNKSDGIEVSYNAAGTLSHIGYDGPEGWIEGSITRNEMLSQLEAAIESWDINSQRNINYRSFQPILRLLGAHHTYQVQLWATWAIANLCTVSPDKYCTLLEKENGVKKLEEIYGRQGTHPKVKSLIERAMSTYRTHTVS